MQPIMGGVRFLSEKPVFKTKQGIKPYLVSNGLDSLTLSAPRFSGLLNEDYHTEIRMSEPINPATISAILRSLMRQHWIKQANGDTSALKLFIDDGGSNSFLDTSRAALADVLALIDRPVDIIVKSEMGNIGMMALQSATGKRLMYDGADISIGPVQNGAPYARNDDHNIRRELSSEYVRDLEHQIMTRTGITDRSKLYWEDLNRNVNLNALQALVYGQYGLVDGVIVGYDQVVTRKDLETYIARKKLSGDKLTAFLANTHNIKKLSTQSLKTFSPASIPNQAPNLYRSPKALIEKAEAEAKAKAADAKKAANTDKTETAAASPDQPNKLTFYTFNKEGVPVKVPVEKLPVASRIISKAIQPSHTLIDPLPDRSNLIEDDVIFFNDGFEDGTAQQITDGLLQLDQRKTEQAAATGNASHIKILVNSPGGSISAGQDIRSTIRQLRSKVDVIVTGMAASCGAFLTSSATGVRMATPSARIMIHDAWWQMARQSNALYSDKVDILNQSTRFFVRNIAEASGRSEKDVYEDMKWDVWLNPLESMFYGSKGLTDVILVGTSKDGKQQGITKADVLDYLIELTGSADAANLYVKNRLKSLRQGNENWKPETHPENDPFSNPLRTIQEVAKRAAKSVDEIKLLENSLPQKNTGVTQITVVTGPGAS